MSTTLTETLGQPVPPCTAHAISVSLPTWRDNVGYEEGERRVIDAMVTGYPRFFIHKSIQKVSTSLSLSTVSLLTIRESSQVYARGSSVNQANDVYYVHPKRQPSSVENS